MFFLSTYANKSKSSVIIGFLYAVPCERAYMKYAHVLLFHEKLGRFVGRLLQNYFRKIIAHENSSEIRVALCACMWGPTLSYFYSSQIHFLLVLMHFLYSIVQEQEHVHVSWFLQSTHVNPTKLEMRLLFVLSPCLSSTALLFFGHLFSHDHDRDRNWHYAQKSCMPPSPSASEFEYISRQGKAMHDFEYAYVYCLCSLSGHIC